MLDEQTNDVKPLKQTRVHHANGKTCNITQVRIPVSEMGEIGAIQKPRNRVNAFDREIGFTRNINILTSQEYFLLSFDVNCLAFDF